MEENSRFLDTHSSKRNSISVAIIFLYIILLQHPHLDVAASGPIESMSKTFHFCRHAKIEIEWKEVITSGVVDKPLVSRYRAIVRSDDDRVLVTRFIILDGQNQFVRNDSAFNNLEVFQTSLMVEAKDPRLPKGRVGLTLLSEKAGKPSQKPCFELPLTLTGSTLVFGQFLGKPLDQLFPNPTIHSVVRDETSLECKSDSGKAFARLSAINGFLPVELTVDQDAESFRAGQKISEINMNGGKAWPRGGISSCRFVARIHEFGIEGTIPFIKSWTSEELFVCERGVEVKIEIAGKVTSANFGGRFNESELLPDIVNTMSLPVTVEGASQLSYYWDGKWPRPRIGELERTKIRYSSYPTLPFVGLFLMLVTFGIFVMRRWKKWQL